MDESTSEMLTHFTGTKSVKAVPATPQRATAHNKTPRKKHSTAVTTSKWSKQNGRDEFSSNEDLATCSGGKHKIMKIKKQHNL